MSKNKEQMWRFGWILIMTVMIWSGGAPTPDALRVPWGATGIAAAWADPALPVGAVPMGTVNAEIGEQGKLAAEQEAAFLASQKFKDFRNFFVIWVMLMLVGFLIWKYRPRQPWVPQSAPSKPEVEVEVEEEVDASVLRPVLSDEQSRRSRDTMTMLALAWEERYGLSPLNLSVLAARDAALMVGMSDERYSLHMQDRVFPAPSDVDFIYNKKKFIVRSVRHSPSTDARHVPKAHASGWDSLVFIVYDAQYAILGAWQMSNDEYMVQCAQKERLVPEDYQVGKRLPSPGAVPGPAARSRATA
ncbi:MAG: hypothetical protein HQL99_06345 [Magnetococcales bacterium]|nr:hypothetical protein [Magnetococcales bacterium]